MDEKLKYNFGPYGNPSGGYTPMGVENVGSTSGDEETGKDLVENYVYRTNPLTSNEDTKTSNRHPRELTDVVGEYFGKMDSLCSILNRMTAMAFGLDLDYFNDFFFPGPNGNSLRIAHYPPQSESSDNRIRYGAHTDYQTFTILSPSPTDDLEGYGGLEVLVGEEWVKVESRGGLVVNAGDLWVDWTGGRWKSGMHRVTNPTTERGRGEGRLSIPFFTGPRPKTVVGDVWGEGKGVEAGEHLRRKLEKSNG